jgi:hypothetical protein
MGKNINKTLGLIIITGLIIRIFLAIGSDNFNHPDENFQITEQAHRLVFGYGTIPWDIRHEIRSWLMPGMVAGLLWPFKALGIENPNIYIPGLKILMAVFSLITIFSAYHIGKRLSGTTAGLAAAFLCAVWYDLVYFSIRPLSEVWAGTFFIAALALVLNKHHRPSLILAGLLACLTAALRINYLPAVLVLLALSWKPLDKTNRMILILSFLGGTIAVGLFEKFTTGSFFATYINYYHYNQVYYMGNRSIGSSFSFEYLLYLGYASLFLYWIVTLAAIKFRAIAKPLLLIIAAVIGTHLILPAHKHLIDYRHIYIVLPLIMAVAGIILAELKIIVGDFNLKNRTVGLTAAVVMVLSLAGAFGELPGQNKMYEDKIYDVSHDTIFRREPSLQAYRYLHDQENMIGLYDASSLWFQTGGYFYLHRDIPIYYVNKPALSEQYYSHILTRGKDLESNGFRLLKKFEDIHVYVRNAGHFAYRKDPDFTYDINQHGVDDNRLLAP